MNICVWSQEDFDGDIYDTGCGHVYILTEGTPKENDMKFCCFCGCKLKQKLYVPRKLT